jgi:hypothetical protein
MGQNFLPMLDLLQRTMLLHATCSTVHCCGLFFDRTLCLHLCLLHLKLLLPTALLQRAVDANGTFKVEVVVQMRQSPMQRDVVRQLLPQAEASWWAPGHIGWTIFPTDTDTFEVCVA